MRTTCLLRTWGGVVRSAAGLAVALSLTAYGRSAAANMVLDVDLLTCDAPGVAGSSPSGWHLGRVTLTSPDGATVLQQENVPVLTHYCSARVEIQFTPAALDALLAEDLSILVEQCRNNATTCAFADEAPTVIGPTPLNTLLRDVVDLVVLDMEAYVDARIAVVEAHLAAEAAARAAADAALQAGLDAETAARMAADAALQVGLDAETVARTAMDAALQAGLDAETAARVAADTALHVGLDAEIAVRLVADAALQGGLDAETAARMAADVALQVGLDAETTARITADAALQAGLDAETVARITADTALQAGLDAETAARIAADAALQAGLDAEIAARIAADAAFAIDLDHEAATRFLFDEGLELDILSLEADAATLQAGLDAEIAARVAADTAFAIDLDHEAATRFLFDEAFEIHIGSVEADMITSVIPGAGLIGGATSGDAVLAVDPEAFQRRIFAVCPAGTALTAVHLDGSVACGTFDMNPGDDITTLIAAGGVTIIGAGNTRTVGLAGFSCPAGSAIRQIASDGTVACEPDDVGTGGDNLGNHTATASLNMNGYRIFNVGDVDANGIVYAPKFVSKTTGEPLVSVVNLRYGCGGCGGSAGVPTVWECICGFFCITDLWLCLDAD